MHPSPRAAVFVLLMATLPFCSSAQKHLRHKKKQKKEVRSELFSIPGSATTSAKQENGLLDAQNAAIVNYHNAVVNGRESSVIVPREELERASENGQGAYVVLIRRSGKIGVAILSLGAVGADGSRPVLAPEALYPLFYASCIPNCEAPVSSGGYGGKPQRPSSAGVLDLEDLAKTIGDYKKNRNRHTNGFYVPQEVINHLTQSDGTGNNLLYLRAYFFQVGVAERVALVPADINYKTQRSGAVWIVSGNCLPNCE